MAFVNDLKILYEKQLGFQKKKNSTVNAMINPIDNPEKAIGNNLCL